MASVRSIRKLRYEHPPSIDYRRCAEASQAYKESLGKLIAMVSDAMWCMKAMFHPDHIFKVGEYATRDGTDVHRVTYANDRFADFECVRAPASGWCKVGDVEHNAMRRYTLLADGWDG